MSLFFPQKDIYKNIDGPLYNHGFAYTKLFNTYEEHFTK